MRVCGIDLETTGLDFQKDYITEIAWIIKDIGDPKPLSTKSFLVHPRSWWDNGFKLSEEIIELTKITEKHLRASGKEFVLIMDKIDNELKEYGVDYIVAHNGENFDRPMLLSVATRMAKCKEAPELILNELPKSPVFSLPWLDTKADIVYPHGWSTSLRYVAAELGFLNPFPHSALFDVATMLKVLECFDIEKVIERNKEPWVVLKACTSYDEREKAKKRRFSWEQCGDKTYPKTWVKRVKASEAQREISEADFQIVILEG